MATTTTTVATNWLVRSDRVTDRMSPKSSAVTSVANDRAFDTMTIPSDSMPTKSRPIPVSSRIADRDETSDTRPAITAAATNAPAIGLNPPSTASAIPGMTPWARASPRKARPRRTTQVPIREVATTASRPASNARCMKAGSNASITTGTVPGLVGAE